MPLRFYRYALISVITYAVARCLAYMFLPIIYAVMTGPSTAIFAICVFVYLAGQDDGKKGGGGKRIRRHFFKSETALAAGCA